MIKRIASFLVASGLLAGHGAQAAEYRWLNSWDRTLPQITMFVEPYIKAVEAASQGRIKFNVSGPETVPAFEQLQPVSSGAFQFLFTHGAYHFGTNPLLAAVEALGGTPEQRRTSGVLEYVDKQYQKLGVKLVAMPMTKDGGYQIVLRKPLTANGDLAGHKIRGNPTYQNVIRMLGASMVTLPPGEIYTALDKGVVDGFAWPAYGVIDTRFYEPSKFLLRPSFGFGTNPLLVHLATWNKMPEADRKIMLDEARKFEDKWLKDSERLMNDDEKALAGKGVTVVHMADTHKARVQRAWSDGLWELSAAKFKKEVDEMRALAKAKGID